MSLGAIRDVFTAALLVLGLVLLQGSECFAREAHYSYEIVGSYSHHPKSFTQGLALEGGILYESTGLYGKSSVMRSELKSGRKLSERPLDSRYFGEGLTIVGGRIIQITWREGKGFVYDKESLILLTSFSYPGEGWGLAYDGSKLILSDGTPFLRFLDPKTFKEERRLEVRSVTGAVPFLNELEFVEGEIFANIWRTDKIARISPTDGLVKGWIDIGGLRALSGNPDSEAIANGIAFEQRSKRLIVTGKYWSKVFDIRPVKKGD
jgi:glutamine cyclotransferase